MNKPILACAAILAAVVLTGCVNKTDITDDRGAVFDVTAAEQSIHIGQSTLPEVRSKLGTPSLIVKQKSSSAEVAGFTFTDDLGNMAASLAKAVFSFGIAADRFPYIQKNIYVKFNEEGKASEVRSVGYSYQLAHRVKSWTEFEHRMTEEELRDTSKRDDDYMERIYLEGVAKHKHTTVDKLTDEDRDRETHYCNIACFALRGLKDAYGEEYIKTLDLSNVPNPEKQEGDGVDKSFFKPQ